MWMKTATSRSAASDVRSASTSSLRSSGRVAPTVKAGVSLYPMSVRTLGTQAVALPPNAIAKLIEQPGWPEHRRIGGRSVDVQNPLIEHTL